MESIQIENWLTESCQMQNNSSIDTLDEENRKNTPIELNPTFHRKIVMQKFLPSVFVKASNEDLKSTNTPDLTKKKNRQPRAKTIEPSTKLERKFYFDKVLEEALVSKRSPLKLNSTFLLP